MIKKKIKKENGFVASETLLSLLIIILFTGIIATMIYYIYMTSTSAKRLGTANMYITNILEKVDKLYYDDITVANLKNHISKEEFNVINESSPNKIIITSNNSNEQSQVLGNSNNPSAYKIEIEIDYYNKETGNNDKLDLVKTVTVKITYKLGKKDQTVMISRIKQRETLITPNRPDFTLLALNSSEKLYPIKKINNVWKVCKENDIEWFNYENGFWATVIVSEESLESGVEINIDNFKPDNAYVWIPRYAYDATNRKILFLYSNINRFVNKQNDYNVLANLPNTFTVSNNFKDTTNTNISGLWVKDSLSPEYTNLNSIYENKTSIW